MPSFDTAYLIVTGTGASEPVAPQLIAGLVERFPRVLTIPTPNASRTLSLFALSKLPGNHQVIESYFDAAILPRPADGLVLVAPCGFNSLNKLAWGIADTLALSVAAEAIGRGTPVVVGIACNTPLWAHPRAQESAATLRSWGCQVLDPVRDGERTMLAPVEEILAAVDRALAGGTDLTPRPDPSPAAAGTRWVPPAGAPADGTPLPRGEGE